MPRDRALADRKPGTRLAPVADSSPLRHDPVLAAFSVLANELRDRASSVARQLGLPPSAVTALGQMGEVTSMRELAERLGCERSFVSAIADSLNALGLARRVADPHDRRVRNLALTPQGRAVRDRVDQSFFAHLPWIMVLDEDERATLLALLTKLQRAEHG